MEVKNSRIFKIAGLSLIGFCAVSIGVDKANVGPVASQMAGFCGAFLGAWAGSKRRRQKLPAAPDIAEINNRAPVEK